MGAAVCEVGFEAGYTRVSPSYDQCYGTTEYHHGTKVHYYCYYYYYYHYYNPSSIHQY